MTTNREKLRLLLSVAVTLIWTTGKTRAEDARSFANRFYHAHREWGIRGVPFPWDVDRIAPYFDDEILACFHEANVQRGEWLREFNQKDVQYPQAWRPEGDVFCCVYEGITYFSIGKVEEFDGCWFVEANLESIRGPSHNAWTDQLVLVRSGTSWKIADIAYQGSPNATLVSSLKAGLSTVARKIKKHEPF